MPASAGLQQQASFCEHLAPRGLLHRRHIYWMLALADWLILPGGSCRYLRGADLQLCRERRQLVQRVKQLESAVAGMLGLAMVYTHQSMLLAPEYRSLLEALAAAALDMEPGGALWLQEKASATFSTMLRWRPLCMRSLQGQHSLSAGGLEEAACDRSQDSRR